MQQRYYNAAASPDGRFAAFGSSQARVLVVDAKTGDRLHWSAPPTPRSDYPGAGCRCVAFLPTGELVVGDDAGRVSLFGAGGAGLHTLANRPRTGWSAAPSPVGCVSAVGGTVVVASKDGSVTAFRPFQRPPQYRIPLLRGADDEVARSVVVLRRTGTTRDVIATSRVQMGVRLTEPATGIESTLTKSGSWLSVCTAPDGRRLFAGGMEGELAAWEFDAETPRPLWKGTLPRKGDVQFGGVAADGSAFAAWVVATGTTECVVAVVDAGTGRPRSTKPASGMVGAVALSPDGRLAAVSQQGRVSLLDASSLDPAAPALEGGGGEAGCLSFSPDAALLAAGVGDVAVLWDCRSGRVVRRWRPDAGEVTSVAFSPDGAAVLTASPSQPPRLWDVRTGRMLLDFGLTFEPGLAPDGRRQPFAPAAFTPDGARIVVGRYDAVTVLDGQGLSSYSGTGR